jgi:hypothetical protein
LPLYAFFRCEAVRVLEADARAGESVVSVWDVTSDSG